MTRDTEKESDRLTNAEQNLKSLFRICASASRNLKKRISASSKRLLREDFKSPFVSLLKKFLKYFSEKLLTNIPADAIL